MEPHVKERIVGAAVLIAVGVWVIPWILDGPDEVASESESLPEFTLPAVEPIATVRTENPAREPAREPALEPARETEAAPTPTSTPTTTTTPATASAAESEVRSVVGGSEDASPAEPPQDRSGWSVQLGAFSDRANADQLAKRVSTYGYSAYVSEFQSSGKAMYRVRVGGFASENSADAAASSISAHSIPVRVISPE